MPLELGMAMGLAAARLNTKEAHAWYVLAPKAHPYARFISDTGGYDVAQHDGTEVGILKELLLWFNTLAPYRHMLPRQVLEVKDSYQESLAALPQSGPLHLGAT